VLINKSLNLVVALEREGSTLYVHAMPVRYEFFKRFYLVFAKTFAALGQQGIKSVAGPRVALMMLEEISKSTAREPGVSWWEGDDGVERGLLPEIVRLCNMLAPGETPDAPWAQTPLQVVLDRQLLTQEEADDVLNQLAFFTLAWAAPRIDREMMTRVGAGLYHSLVTSLNCTEYAASLRTSTTDESTGASEETAGQPSSRSRSSGSPAPAGPISSRRRGAP
jgi:hypothetical protein